MSDIVTEAIAVHSNFTQSQLQEQLNLSIDELDLDEIARETISEHILEDLEPRGKALSRDRERFLYALSKPGMTVGRFVDVVFDFTESGGPD